MHSRGGLLGPTSRHHAYVAWWNGYSIHNHDRTCGCLGRKGRPIPLRIDSMELVLHLTFSVLEVFGFAKIVFSFAICPKD